MKTGLIILYYKVIGTFWGIGDWGLGIGDWGLGPIPNPQSPIPNEIIKIFYSFCLNTLTILLMRREKYFTKVHLFNKKFAHIPESIHPKDLLYYRYFSLRIKKN